MAILCSSESRLVVGLALQGTAQPTHRLHRLGYSLWHQLVSVLLTVTCAEGLSTMVHASFLCGGMQAEHGKHLPKVPPQGRLVEAQQ